MDIFGILDPDSHENLCGSETLPVEGLKNILIHLRLSKQCSFKFISWPILLRVSTVGATPAPQSLNSVAATPGPPKCGGSSIFVTVQCAYIKLFESAYNILLFKVKLLLFVTYLKLFSI